MSELNSPVKLGDLHLKNSVVMSPLTRSRATDERVPTDMMVEYYAQRASSGEPYRVCRRVNILRDYSDEKTKLYPRN